MYSDHPKCKRTPVQPRAPRDASAHWLTPAEAAHHLGMSPATLARKRVEGSGPPFHRPSRRFVRYSRLELDTWMGERQSSTQSVRSLTLSDQ